MSDIPIKTLSFRNWISLGLSAIRIKKKDGGRNPETQKASSFMHEGWSCNDKWEIYCIRTQSFFKQTTIQRKYRLL